MARLRNWPWLKIVLGLSLALNLAVAGLVAGAVLSHDERAGRVPFDRDRSLFSLIAVMPPEHQDTLRDRLGDMRQGHRAARQEQEAMRAAFLGQLRSAEPSGPEMLGLLEAQRLRRAEGAERIEDAVVSEILLMSPVERQGYADRLERLSRFRDRERPHPHK